MATWVDVLTSTALYLLDPKFRFSVSLSLTVDYINGAPIDQPLLFKCKVIKTGKMIGFSEAEIMSIDQKWLASASHKKAFNDVVPVDDLFGK